MFSNVSSSKTGKGEEFEEAFCGFSHQDVERKGISARVERDSTERFLGFCIEEVRSFQGQFGWVPDNPNTEFAKIFYNKVRAKLFGSYRNTLRLFVSVGTVLDYKFGTDFFLDVRGLGSSKVIRIDLTMKNRGKKKGNGDYQPDFSLTPQHFSHPEQMDRLCDQIALMIKNRVGEEKQERSCKTPRRS
jgi:hypothetical protein